MAAANHNPSFYSRHRVLVWASGIIIAVVLLASFISRDEVVPVRAATVERGTLRSLVSTNGKIEPIHDFEAHAPVGTTVEKVLAKEGDHVKKGQLLAQLDDSQARSDAARALAQVRAADASLNAIQSGGTREEVLTTQSQLVKARTARDAAQRNLEALQRLQQTGAASPGEVLEAKNQLARAEADLKLLEQKQQDRYSRPEVAQVEAQKGQALAAYDAAEDILKQMNIRAPFDGVVYSLPVRQGMYLNPGDLVLQEADLTKVLVRAFVDEPDVGRLTRGQKIELTWDAVPGRVWTGALDSVPASLKLHGTRNVGEVTCVVENRDLSLLPNVNVGVTIVTNEDRNVLIMPREALRIDEKNNTYVYAIQNGELQRRDVKTSISNLTAVEITDGLSEKTLVALGSINGKNLRNHLAVRTVP